MADLLDIILRHMRVSGTGAPVLIRILNGLQQYMPMPEVERALIHGMSHLQLAAQETISVLRKYYRYAAYEPRTFDFLKPAAMNCNPDLCQAIINVFEQESFYHELMPTESDELMYICISVACESGIESVSAFKMLDLATSIGCNINCYSETGRTPLFVIIDRQRPELLDWILENPRLDLAARDQAGNTALHLLITSGLSATYDMQKLLSKGVDPNWVNTEGERPLGIAQANRKFEEFKTLLSVTKLTLDERRQLIYSAVKADAPKLVSANLQEYKSHYGSQTDVAMLDHALTLATEFSGGEVGEILFQSGADPTRKTDNGTATIHESAEQGNIDILNLCLKAAHHVDQENGVGTPLLIATSVLVRDDHRQLGARACADALLDAGANPSPADSDSRTPLAFLLQADKRVRTKHTSLIKILLEKGADPNEGRLSPFIEYPLSKAIKEEDFDLADLLVEHNISLDRQGKDGNYPLHALASISTNLTIDQTNESRPAKLAARLLQNGADPLSVNTRGTTPLEDAVLSANGPLTLAILQHLATPADIAEGSFQRTFGQETGTGTKIFGMRLRKSKKDKEHTTYKLQPVPRRISNIQQSWGLAVFWESSASMCAFLRAGVNGPTSFLTRRLAILLLRYAMQNAIDDVLAMFMGGLNDNMEPDNYLKAVWDSVRDFFPWGADHAQLQSYPFLYKYRRDGRLDGSRFAHLLEADDDMPSNMMPYYYRLQYCNAIDRYARFFPASHLVAHHYIEAQSDSDLKEAVVDEEAEKKKKQYAALQSIGLFGEMEDGFTYDSGF
ncbi:ankyrin repeat-containing domain protein [Massariosphaeria phaeospora]|uniref:Ankyrin repeat-containing domain protein n=1 Tax=Massariosphaeria phaeospora TaxID=100035 RepID=A0A7C8HZL5_9PLEO|nr:ankyrin repeat-containing domain protein [Massariosphaeria phaeospora]